MKKLLAVAALLVFAVTLVGCASQPNIPNDPQSSTWEFREGPYGLHCVFVRSGKDYSSAMGMDCDWSSFDDSKWEDIVIKRIQEEE